MRAQGGAGAIIIFIIIIIGLLALFYLSGNTTKTPQAKLSISPSGTISVQSGTFSVPVTLNITGLNNNNNTIYQVRVSSTNVTNAYVVYAVNNTPFTQFNTGKIQNGLSNYYQIKIFGRKPAGITSAVQYMLNFTLYYNKTLESSQPLSININ